MSLVIDIGNSYIKLAVFRQDKIVYEKQSVKFLVKDLKAIHKKFPFEHVILSTVRTSLPSFTNYLKRNFKFLQLTHNTSQPVKMLYKTPSTLGLDRLAAIVGAYHEKTGKNVLVVDIGTCITYDFLDSHGVYHGGNIAPGVELRLLAMHDYTSALPLVKRANNEDVLGKSTKTAMQNGAVKGIKFEIESFIRTLTKKTKNLTVILTGGDASYFGEMLESKIFVDPKLVLKGLHEILKYNIH